MFWGISANVLEGLLFIVIGIVMSRVARNNYSSASYFFYGTAIAFCFFSLVTVSWDNAADTPYLLRLILVMFLASTLNNIGHLLMMYNMKTGHKGASWAIGQSAMIIPFATSTFLWNEQCGLWGWLGIGSVVGGIALLATSRRGEHNEKINLRWLLLTLFNFVLYGCSQTLTSAPSQWEGFSDVAHLRPVLQMFVTALFFLLIILCKKKGFDRRAIPLGGVYGAILCASYILIFWLLDHMASLGFSRVVWPMAIGTCIIGFSLYSRFQIKEPFNGRDLTGLSAILGGLVLLAIG